MLRQALRIKITAISAVACSPDKLAVSFTSYQPSSQPSSHPSLTASTAPGVLDRYIPSFAAVATSMVSYPAPTLQMNLTLQGWSICASVF